MKIQSITALILTILYLQSTAQDYKNKLSFEFGYGINSYSMAKLNEFYIDSFASKPNICLLKEKITSGQNFNLVIKYQPSGLFDVGFYGGYQYGNSKYTPSFIETNEFGLFVKEHIGSYELSTEAISIGITNTWYVSHLLKFQVKESKFLNRFHLGVDLNAGIGFSKVSSDIRVDSYPVTSFYDYFTSRDFQGQAGLKFEYDFARTPIFTTLGIRFGYQYFITNTVKDRLERDWETLGKYPINLDFSGFYFGTYLKFGK